MRVYLDGVFLLNFTVDFLLLLASNRMSGYPPGGKRCAAGAAVGGLYGGLCFIPGLEFLGSLLFRCLSFLLISFLAYGRHLLARGALFLLFSLALAGGSLILHQKISIFLILGLLLGISFISGTKGFRRFVPVSLEYMGKTVKFHALFDTGNQLHDPISGKPVMVADPGIARQLLNLNEEELKDPCKLIEKIPGLRLIPYQSVGCSSSVLPALRIQKALIGESKKEVIVAFSPNFLSKNRSYEGLIGGTML